MPPASCQNSSGVIGNRQNKRESRICVGAASLIFCLWALYLVEPNSERVQRVLHDPRVFIYSHRRTIRVRVLLRSILFINSFAVHRFVRPQLREFNHTSAIVLHSSLFLLVFLIRRQGLAFSARSIVFWTVDNQRRRRAAIAGFRTCCSEAGSICVSPPTKSTYPEPFGRSGTLVHIKW